MNVWITTVLDPRTTTTDMSVEIVTSGLVPQEPLRMAMADLHGSDAMRDELHQFDRGGSLCWLSQEGFVDQIIQIKLPSEEALYGLKASSKSLQYALLEGYCSLVIVVRLDVKETNLHCICLSQRRSIVALSASCASSNVDEEPQLKIMDIQLQTKYVVLRISVAIAISCNPYIIAKHSTSILGSVLVSLSEDGYEDVLTPADLKFLTNETALINHHQTSTM
ncbi:hypothetical protein Tco_0531516 [Tanacetum coccineum]